MSNTILDRNRPTPLTLGVPLCEVYLLFRQAAEECPVGPIVSALDNLEEAVRCFGYFPEEAEEIVNRSKQS